jgi:glucose/arabinose dehydrogenase
MTSDPRTEVRILEVLQPFSNHNGGSLTFGSDGLLYIPTGDGGGAGDPENNGQSLGSLLGKILRINVDTADPQTRYTIPPSNPFANRGTGVMPEIFAYGLRNPFKVTRDMRSRRIWIADVGQNMREEVNVLRRGANYGWPIMEGELCSNTGLPCSIRRLQKPAWTIPHPKGSSITGGYVYRGTALKRLGGSYIYGDFITGTIWRLATQGGRKSNRVLLSTKLNISSFGQDLSGEIYVVNYSGDIFRLVSTR